jgi:S1-C subfamily serine protease
MSSRRIREFELGLVLALTVAVPLCGQDVNLGKLLDQNAAALVTVQVALQVKASGSMGQLLGDTQDFEAEAVCTIIDPKGLVLCSNTQLNGYTEVMQRVIGRMGGQADFTVTPTRIKVLLGGEPKPLTATLLVRDTDLDLAWLQIERAGNRTFTYFDFAQGASPKVGDSVFAIRRLDRFFDRTPSLLEARIGSITQKPRTLFIPTNGFETNLGIPVLSVQGQPIGLLVLQLPADRSSTERSGVSLESMGWSSRMQDVGRGVILPAQEVARATRRALSSLPEKPVQKN